MKLLHIFLSAILIASFCAHGQYKGKYEGWATGYRFTGNLTAAHYKAFTHIVDFGTMVNSSGTASGGSSSFVSGCHTSGCKALLCVGGAGNSSAFSNACSTPAGITKLVKSIMASVRSGGYDGGDMDWEEAEENNNFDGTSTKIAMFSAFHKEMAESLHAAGKLATAAVCFDWYPKGSQAAAQWEDQANSMTYYDGVTLMPQRLSSGLLGSVAKSKVGVGFGWGTDNEVTDPNDILAKCRWAIDNGFGGVMAWDIARATSVTSWILDSLARYVTHSATEIASGPQQAPFFGARLLVRCDPAAAGGNVITIEGISSVNGAAELAMFDPRGRLVATLFHGALGDGPYAVPLRRNIPSGTYVFRLSTPLGSYSTRASVVR